MIDNDLEIGRQRLLAFQAWFERCGGWLHPDTELVYADNAVHMRVKQSVHGQINKGTPVISCPHGLALSSLNVVGIDISAGLSPGITSGNPYELSLSGAREQCLAAFSLCVQVLLKDKSFWAPYIVSLPWLRHTDLDDLVWQSNKTDDTEINSPVWWTAEQRQWIQGTPVFTASYLLEQIWRDEWDTFHERVIAWAKAQRINTAPLTYHLFKWAMTILNSRAFSSSLLRWVTDPEAEPTAPLLNRHNPGMLLYPGIDLLDHNEHTLNHWFHDESHFGIVCNDEPGPGGPVWGSYGAKNNSQLLLSYGFLTSTNGNDSYPLKMPPDEKSVQRLSHVRPEPSLEQTKPDTEPDKRPVAADEISGTYYIRPSSRIDLDRPELGYPSPSASTEAYICGVPTALLARLSATLANDRELQTLEAQTTHATALPAALGPRNKAAVHNLVFGRLLFELHRLRSSVETTALETTADGVAASRLALARRYRDTTDSILLHNITNMRPHMPFADGCSLVRYGDLLNVLREGDKFAAAQFRNGLETALGTPDLDALQEEDYGDLVWVLWAGAVLALEQMGRLGERPASLVARFAAFCQDRYPENDEQTSLENNHGREGEGEELVQSITEIVAALQGNDGKEETSVWSAPYWTQARIKRAARIVQQESVDVVLEPADNFKYVGTELVLLVPP